MRSAEFKEMSTSEKSAFLAKEIESTAQLYKVRFYKVVKDPLKPKETIRQYHIQVFYPKEWKAHLRSFEKYGIDGVTQMDGFEVLETPEVKQAPKAKGRPASKSKKE